jgi:hypothetical protein
LFVPLLGTISTLATVALLIVLVSTRRDQGWTAARRIRVTVQSGNGINSAFPDDQPLAIYRLSGHLLVHDIGRIASTHGVP